MIEVEQLKSMMRIRQQGIKPPYLDFAPNVLFPTRTNTYCDEVIEDVWKAAWDEAQRVVDDYQNEQSGRVKDNPNDWPIKQCAVGCRHVSHEHTLLKQRYWCQGVKVCGCNECRDPDKPLPRSTDEEVEIISECFQALMRLDDEKARKRALHYLLERMGNSSEF